MACELILCISEISILCDSKIIELCQIQGLVQLSRSSLVALESNVFTISLVDQNTVCESTCLRKSSVLLLSSAHIVNWVSRLLKDWLWGLLTRKDEMVLVSLIGWHSRSLEGHILDRSYFDSAHGWVIKGFREESLVLRTCRFKDTSWCRVTDLEDNLTPVQVFIPLFSVELPQGVLWLLDTSFSFIAYVINVKTEVVLRILILDLRVPHSWSFLGLIDQYSTFFSGTALSCVVFQDWHCEVIVERLWSLNTNHLCQWVLLRIRCHSERWGYTFRKWHCGLSWKLLRCKGGCALFKLAFAVVSTFEYVWFLNWCRFGLCSYL